MKTTQPQAPKKLEETQEWFAGVITQPLRDGNHIDPITPSGEPIEPAAAKRIEPSPTLEPWQRIEIYNQQYWWRIFKILQELYPLATRLFGYFDFNQTIAVPYMRQFPSKHWSIDLIGTRLPIWIREHYNEEDKQLVHDAIDLDYAFQNSFDCELLPTIDISQQNEEGLSLLLRKKIHLQPFIHLFAFDYDLFQFRDAMLAQEPDYWIDHDFPELTTGKRCYGVVYRTHHDNVVWDSLSSAEFHVLWKFHEGCTIEQACEWLEKQNAGLTDEAAAHIHFWFQEWTLRGWLTLETSRR